MLSKPRNWPFTVSKLFLPTQALKIGLLIIPAVALALPQPAHAAAKKKIAKRRLAKATALETFKARHEQVVALVKKKASTKKIQAEVDELLDYEWIAQASLGGKNRYESRCGSRCGEFQELLTQLIRENYLRLIQKAEGKQVEYLEQVRGKLGKAFLVKTRITITKEGREQQVTVAYVMHKLDEEGGWQVRDIITDDVSLAKTYRYEFNRIYKRDGINGIIEKLQNKLQTLAQRK